MTVKTGNKPKLRVISHQLISPEAIFIAKMYLLLLSLFALQRLFLLFHNTEKTGHLALSTQLKTFLVGGRFDLAVSSYLLLALLLPLLSWPRLRSLLPTILPISLSGLVLAGLAEAEFYREFESRFNGLVVEYLSHPITVVSMLWDGYPILRYLLYWAIMMAILIPILRRIIKPLLINLPTTLTIQEKLGRTMGNTILVVLMVFALRGGFQHEPLRWGDAFFSPQPFANHLALNGFFTLGRTAWDKIYSKQAVWANAMPPKQALTTTRSMLIGSGETSLLNEQYPLLRTVSTEGQTLQRHADQPPVNVVVILMESFSGRMVGALGSGVGITPEFDQLAEQGVLFERAFSSGTHTHQGVYASLTSFPNLPGYEYLMKMMEANQNMSSLPSLLKRQNYQTMFLYNGEFSWDNKEGFFRQHGMDNFIGLDQYQDPYYIDPVWGVSDLDVYRRANDEFKQLADNGPFFATILTLSNHSPFNLPQPLPFKRVVAPPGQEGRYNAMRFADWSLGEFFKLARQEDYFDNTLFVLLGDHGFPSPPMVTAMGLSRFHIPLLFYAPKLLPAQRRSTVASQVDVVPSVLGLLGTSIKHQSWGRNLFSTTQNDNGFAVIKPSGGEERVAIIDDNYLLELAPKENARMYRYKLGNHPSATADLSSDQPQLSKRLQHKLQSYVETAILALRQRSLSVPK